MDRSDRLNLSYVAAAQAQKHVTVNETVRSLDALVHMAVVSRSVSAEPTDPQPGQGYVLSGGRTGAGWESFAENQVVVWQDGKWFAYGPKTGMSVYVEDEQVHIIWDGSAWSISSPGQRENFGINTASDPTNKLAVKSDAVLFSHDDVTPGSGDMRHVVNKQAEANTASILFQNAFSARAEFGLTGTDDFVMKVSPDGTNFFDAIIIDRTSGAVSFPRTPSFGTVTPRFSPADISDLIGWWDPDDATSVAETGGAVSGLADKSATGADFVQSDGALQPQLAAAGINGRAALSFSGAQVMNADAVAPLISGEDQPFSLHFVVRGSHADTIHIALGAGNSGDASEGIWFGVHTDEVFRWVKRSGTSKTLNPVGWTDDAHLVSIIHDGVDTSFWVDGVRLLQQVSQDVPAFSLDRFAIGAWDRTSADFFFTGEVGEMVVYNRATTEEETRDLQRYLGDKWLDLPQAADLFLAIGQSNMMGKGPLADSPSVATGAGYEWSVNGAFEPMRDPQGNSIQGSCLPAFANRWRADTGRAAMVVSEAVGSTSLLPEADSGFGNWDKESGTLYDGAVGAMNAALTHVAADTIYTINGVYGLWAQGEGDATRLHAGLAGVTAASYEVALNDLISDLQSDLSTPLDRFFIFELGARDDGAQETAYTDIRSAQNAVAAARSDTDMIFDRAKFFPAEGKMFDTLHYSGSGYNEMGTSGAANAVLLVNV